MPAPPQPAEPSDAEGAEGAEGAECILLAECSSASAAPRGAASMTAKVLAAGAAVFTLSGTTALGAASARRRWAAGAGSARSLLSEECSASFDMGADCGDLALEDCEAAGCCYDEGNSAHRCWRSADVQWKCNTDAAGGDCGEASRERCEEMGCCYDETAQHRCYPKTRVGFAVVDVPAADVVDVPSAEVVDLGSPAGSGPSLFCFSVATSAEERALLGVQESAGAGISACEEWKIIDGAPSSGFAGSQTNSWTNVEPFIGAWKAVAADARWSSHDWTVKVDPDCAFFPGKLREWLNGQDPGGGAYVRNCMDVDNGLYGALEVISRAAVDIYLQGLDSCQGEIQDQGGMGEDLFAEKCMDMKGVAGWDYGDLVCNIDCGCDPHPCSTGRIGYHKFKDTGTMQACMDEAFR